MIENSQLLTFTSKPANIFLLPSGRLKVGDFGLGRAMSDATAKAFSTVGTPLYMAPEVLRGKGHDAKSDIWSLGCVLYELCMLRSPFYSADSTMVALFQRIVAGKYAPAVPARQCGFITII